MKLSVCSVAIPLQISGTVNKSLLFPSKTGLLGAAAGTAVLGTGVGKSVAIKAVGSLDNFKKLFAGGK